MGKDSGILALIRGPVAYITLLLTLGVVASLAIASTFSSQLIEAASIAGSFLVIYIIVVVAGALSGADSD